MKLDDIGRLRGNEFQEFCNRLLALDDPGFQAVDGAGGDLGNDGFRANGETLFQAYAPNKRVAAKFRAKVDDSIEKAKELRATSFPNLKTLVLLTPFDLTHEQHEYFRSACATQDLAAESWGESRLEGLVGRHPAIRSLYPEFLVADVLAKIDGAPIADAGANSRSLAAASSESLRWPRTLPNGEILLRPELHELATRIASGKGGRFALLGPPGAGKSALMAALGERLNAEGTKVVALRCDRIPAGVDDRGALAGLLGLSEALDRVLASMAGAGPTVLLLDQLDALCDMIDLRSERLNVVLDLLDRVRDVDGLGVVVACREFDYRHDPRLVRLDAEAVHLTLPSWTDVAAVLGNNGISPEKFPSSMREVLRVPQQLKVFLSLSGNRDSLQNYQGMLEQLWQQRVTGNADRVALAARITEVMDIEEVLIVPAAIVDGMTTTLHELVHDGVLRFDETSRQVSFAHQTLFEFARARSFGANRDLVQYVKERQDGVFVRPVLWQALTYLRGSSPATYARNLQTLWDDTSLRTHLRYLLLEFVGQVDGPSDDEFVLLLGAVRDGGRCATALTAIVGNASWFARLQRVSAFDEETAEHAPEALATVLSAATRFAPDIVATVLEPISSTTFGSRITLSVLLSAESWPDGLAAFARAFVNAEHVDTHTASSLVSRASGFAPALAVEIVGVAFNAMLARARAPSEDDDYTRNDEAADAIFDFAGSIYDLASLATRVPMQTLEAIFPVWAQINARLGSKTPATATAYQREGALDVIADAPHPNSLGVAIKQAIESAARNEPTAFVDFARKNEASDLNGVHAMLAFGYASLPEEHRRAGLAYVLREPRRLRLHGIDAADSISVMLLRAIACILIPADMAGLESAIAKSEVADEHASGADVETRRARMRLNRRHRLRLLRAIPEGLLSTEAKRIVREESLVFTDADDVPSMEGGVIGSPMSAGQMEKATDEDILGLFDELVDSTDFEHPRRWLAGGSVQAARELGEVAKRAPVRVAALLPKLRATDQQAPMTEALCALAAVDFVSFEDLLLAADARGFAGDDFRTMLAFAIADRARKGKAPSAAVIEMLERWLAEAPPAEPSPSEDATTLKEPILFGHIGGGVLPRGGYPMLHALLCAFLQEKPPAIERWLACVERRLMTNEAITVWSALCYDLPKLRLVADKKRIAAFFEALINKHPALLATRRGAFLIAHLVTTIDERLLDDWLTRQRKSQHAVAEQAAGELFMFCALRRSFPWVIDVLTNVNDETEPFRVGAAFAAAHTWGDASDRRTAAKWLEVRFAVATGHELKALFSAYNPRQELWADTAAVAVLRAMQRNVAALRDFPHEAFDQLELLVAHEGEFVAQFMDAILDAMVANGLEPAARFYWAGGVLVDIALALQRRRATRSVGMSLFERLLSLGFSSVRDTLFEIDARPRRDPPRPRAPRLRHRA